MSPFYQLISHLQRIDNFSLIMQLFLITQIDYKQPLLEVDRSPASSAEIKMSGAIILQLPSALMVRP